MDFGDVNLSDVDLTDVIARLSATVDVASLDASLFPCLTSATQRAGVSFELATEALRNDFFPNRA